MKNNKLWVFQSIKNLTGTEEKEIADILNDFFKSWAAHGEDLKANLRIFQHKFIVIEVDGNQTKASGCSIDSLNQCIRKVDEKYKLDLLNRLWVSYETSERIKTLPMQEFKEKLKKSEIEKNSFIYNLSVSTTQEFNDNFKQPLAESWAKNYLN